MCYFLSLWACELAACVVGLIVGYFAGHCSCKRRHPKDWEEDDI